MTESMVQELKVAEDKLEQKTKEAEKHSQESARLAQEVKNQEMKSTALQQALIETMNSKKNLADGHEKKI